MNFCPPASVAKISSIRGSGYWSTLSIGFTVVLKSPQIRTEPFGFITGTIGDAHSLVSTFDNIPSFSSLESSCSTCGLIENGTGLALTNLGVAFSFSVSLAFISATHPIPSLKTFEYVRHEFSFVVFVLISQLICTLYEYVLFYCSCDI